MSVPKRFKTNIQQKNYKVSLKTNLKTNLTIYLDKHLQFIHYQSIKSINKNKLNLNIKIS